MSDIKGIQSACFYDIVSISIPQMQGDLPSQSRGGHRISDAEEEDRTDAGREKEKGVLSSGIFSSKSHRKTANPAHKSLKKFFKSKSR